MEQLRVYGMRRLARVFLQDGSFKIDIEDRALAAEAKCIYAFEIANEIVRIGSSKRILKHRMREWELSVSKAMRGEPSQTPFEEAKEWKRRLTEVSTGTVWARCGTTVTTPIGIFSTYLDEESILIGRHHPPLNRNKHR